MEHPDNIKDFIVWFKDKSETHFATLALDTDAYGLQHQNGTKWRAGLTEAELVQFQEELGFDFPEELKEFYRAMNATDLPGVNIYGDRGDAYYKAPMYFSYPDHLSTIKQLIGERLKIAGLSAERINAEGIPNIFPISEYYYMVIDGKANPIYYLSIAYHNHDLNQPYVYGELYTDTLQSWLVKDVFHQTEHISDVEEFPERVRTSNFWATKTNR